MRQQTISAREALVRHRRAIGLMESRTHPGPANPQHHDSVLHRLREAGFSIAMAVQVYSILDSYIYRFALNEQSLPFDTGEQAAEVAQTIFRQFLADEYPYLVQMPVKHMMQPDYSDTREFEFGLGMIFGSFEKTWKSA